MEVPIALAALFGLRRGEILGLTWDNIDFKNKTITIEKQLVPTSKGIQFQDPKSEDSIRTITLSENMIQILKRHVKRQQQNKLSIEQYNKEYNLINCKSDGTMIDPRKFSHNFANLLNEHKFEHIRFHDLRHSCATLMLSLNVPLKVTSQRLGHSTIGITADLYSHVLDDMQKEATDKIDSMIFGDKIKEEPVQYVVNS